MQVSIGLRLLALCLLASSAWGGEEAAQRVQIVDPYLELHTGPGRGYPVFHVIERGEWVRIHSRRTDWFQVQGADGKRGWVERAQLERTLQPSGEPLAFRQVGREAFAARRWELGVLGGDFSGAPITSLYAGYGLGPNLSVELSYGQALGRYAVNRIWSANLLSHPFPQWRVSPFFTLGTGQVATEPRTTLVRSEDRTDSHAHVGVGLRAYVTRRFLFRAEYRNYVVFQERDENAEAEAWQVGFAVFF